MFAYAFLRVYRILLGCHHYPVLLSFMDMPTGAEGKERAAVTGSGRNSCRQDTSNCTFMVLTEGTTSAKETCSSSYPYSITGKIVFMSKRV
jgi:hypothetical protein